MDVKLYADGGEMTVGRQTASYVYGNFEVRLPDGREQQQTDQRLTDGFIYRPDHRPKGRFDVAFVRADAVVDLQAGTSNLEVVIDAAQKRTEGAVFYERDIGPAGLGRYRPGVDFTTGDVVTVNIWGKDMQLPVTAVDMIGGTSVGTSWRVHVGGQLLHDAAALKSHNDKLQQQIERDRRVLLQAAGQAKTTATQASATASQASAAANVADQKARTAQADATRALQQQADANSRMIKELEAYSAATKIYYERTRPVAASRWDRGTYTFENGTLTVFAEDIVLTPRNTGHVGYMGLSVVVAAWVDAIRGYPINYTLQVAKSGEDRFSVRTRVTESFGGTSVTAYPRYDFSAILQQQRGARGLT